MWSRWLDYWRLEPFKVTFVLNMILVKLYILV